MKQKNRILLAVKLVVLGLCLYLLSRKLDFGEVRSALVLAAPLYLVPAQATILAEPFIMARKWGLLLRHKQIHAGFLRLVRLLFTSNFLSVFLATSVGADAARVFMLARQRHSVTHSTAALLADRLLGLAAMASLSLVGLLVAGDRLPARFDLRLVLGLCLLVLSGIALLLSPLPTAVLRGVTRLLPAGDGAIGRLAARGGHVLAGMHDSLRAFLAAPRLLAGVFAWNVGVQTLRVLQIHCIFRALGVAVPLWQEFAFVPIIVLLSILPISYFGVGVKESAFVYFFSALGVPAPVALSVSILTYPLIVVGLLPGGVCLLWPEPPAPEAAAAAPTAPS